MGKGKQPTNLKTQNPRFLPKTFDDVNSSDHDDSSQDTFEGNVQQVRGYQPKPPKPVVSEYNLVKPSYGDIYFEAPKPIRVPPGHIFNQLDPAKLSKNNERAIASIGPNKSRPPHIAFQHIDYSDKSNKPSRSENRRVTPPLQPIQRRDSRDKLWGATYPHSSEDPIPKNYDGKKKDLKRSGGYQEGGFI